MRALGAFPIAGTDQNLAVLTALLTMKFVNRHVGILTNLVESSSWS